MTRQFKNGSCSCWRQCDKELAKGGTELDVAFSWDGHQYLPIKTIRIDGKRNPPKTVLCSYCPFCGAKLKEASK
jgi:hypothetical protein